MKKFLTLAVMMLLVASYAEFKVTRNKVMGTLGFDYLMNTVTTSDSTGTFDSDDSNMGYDLPKVAYEFEAKPTDMFKLYLYAGAGYAMDQASTDGTAADNFSSDLNFNINPMVKAYLPSNLFVKLALPFAFNSATSDEDDAEAIPTITLDTKTSFGFDNTKIRIHGISPFNAFVKGMSFYGTFDMGLMKSIDGEDAEELPMFFGVYGCYAYYNDKDMMVKPYLSYKMGLNDKVDENGYLNLGAGFAKDFTEQINITAALDFGMKMLAETNSVGDDAINTLMIGAGVNYYVMPELDIMGGIKMGMDLTTEDANPAYLFSLGAKYTLNLLK
ncbi:MAG: hypothetical protein PF574_09245 [Candidatus Delongbacteria bacterium]|nr:hypothetical protein [Candidatus Delongbacteria bacterium]